MTGTKLCRAVNLVSRFVHQKRQQTLSDRELLARFAQMRDERAFAQLVMRHGPLVAGVARRVVGDNHVAEDVFQATFLLLAQKAPLKRWQTSIGPWLHQATYRLACKARSVRARKNAACGADVSRLPAPAQDPGMRLSWQEVQAALEEELQRLPARLREPLTLCYLQDLSRDDAAPLLGLTLATLKRRLESGRTLLRTRLTRRGIALGLAGLGVALSQATVSAALAQETARLGSALAATGTLPSGAPPGAAALLKGSAAGTLVLRAGLAVAVLLLGTVLGGWALSPAESPNPSEPPPQAEKLAPRDKPSPLRGKRVDLQGDPLPPGAILRLGEIRFRPGARTTNLAFSPDGTKLASLGNYLYHHDRLSLWDTATGKELRTELISEGRVPEFAWCADGRGFAIISRPGGDMSDFLVWEFTDPQQRNPAPPDRNNPLEGVKVVAVGQDTPEYYGPFGMAQDGKWLAVHHAGGKKTPAATIFELAPAKSVRDLKPVRTIENLPPDARTLVFTKDKGTLLVFSHKDPNAPTETLTLFDTAGGQKKSSFTIPMALHQGVRKVFAVSPDGARLALGLNDGTARLIDLKDGREIRSVGKEPPKGKGWAGICMVAFSPDSKRLLTGSRDESVRVWDVSSGRELHHLEGHHSWPEAGAFRLDGKQIATSGQDSLIRLWDAETGQAQVAPKGHFHTVWGLDVSRDGRFALTSGWDNTARVWDLATGAEMRSLPRDRYEKSALLPGGMVLTHRQDRWMLWDSARGKEAPLPGALGEDRGRAIGMSFEGDTLVTADEKTVTLWAWPSGKRLEQITLGKCAYRAFFTPDGRTLLTLHAHNRPTDNKNDNGLISLWDRQTGKHQGDLPLRFRNYIDVVTMTRDGILVAVGHRSDQVAAAESTILFCDVRSRRIVREFPVIKSRNIFYLLSLALSADGRTLAVGQSDGNTSLYEVATGQIRRVLVGHRESIPSMTFVPGDRLVTASLDHTALVWDVRLKTTDTVKPIAEDALKELWKQLGDPKPEPAFAALAKLADDPKAAVALFRQHITPAIGIDDATLDRIVEELDSKQFEARRKASEELDRLGDTAIAGVKRRLAKAQSLELRRRLELFLTKWDRDEPTAERLREVRALQLMEELATPEALALLRDLARGNGNARRTEEAAQALARCTPR
jgi:RNA polymerase sigma factor (sigma-70 family)